MVRLWAIMRMLFLLTLANGAPVVAKKIFGDRLSRALDNGARYLDGQPLFGASKTIRGIIFSVLVTVVGGYLLGLRGKTGALIGSIAMSGDIFSSFLKRRMRLPVSSRAIGLDQIPESLFPLLACRRALALTVSDIAVAVITFLISELLISRVLYKFRLRDRPY
jgi:CDP-archaeol synthase